MRGLLYQWLGRSLVLLNFVRSWSFLIHLSGIWFQLLIKLSDGAFSKWVLTWVQALWLVHHFRISAFDLSEAFDSHILSVNVLLDALPFLASGVRTAAVVTALDRLPMRELVLSGLPRFSRAVFHDVEIVRVAQMIRCGEVVPWAISFRPLTVFDLVWIVGCLCLMQVLFYSI